MTAIVRAALANSRGFWSTVGQVDPERIEILEYALAAIPSTDTAERAQLLVTLRRRVRANPSEPAEPIDAPKT